jgi:hypothetical protein
VLKQDVFAQEDRAAGEVSKAHSECEAHSECRNGQGGCVITVNRDRGRPARLPLLRGFLFAMATIMDTLFSAASAAAAEMLVASATADHPSQTRVWREVTDPCLRQHWQWIVDARHPGWPARLVLIGGRDGPADAGRAPAVVIRSGDRLTVDQNSGALTARFQAIALESAAPGELLQVRLTLAGDQPYGVNSAAITPGPVIRVIATGRGEARWEPRQARISVAADGSAR